MCLATASCDLGSGGEAERRVTVADSAGVTIVDHGPLNYDALAQWSLSATAAPRIGMVSGEPAFLWQQIRAADRLSDGTIVALDYGSREVRAFDVDGDHLWTVGREGEGPGEFRFPWSLWVTEADSLMVGDPGQSKVTALTGSGELARDVMLRFEEGPSLAQGPVGTDGILMEIREAEFGEEFGFAKISTQAQLVSVDPNGETTSPFGTHPMLDQYDVIGGGEGAFGPSFFSGPSVFAGSPDGVWFSTSDEYQITLLGVEGRPLRRVRWEGPDRAVGEDDVDRLRQILLSSDRITPESRPGAERYVRDQPVADNRATFERILVDSEGRLWVQDYARPDMPDANTAWTVFTSDGEEVLGRLTHAPDLRILSIGDSWALLVSLDDLGVEYLELRDLEAP